MDDAASTSQTNPSSLTLIAANCSPCLDDIYKVKWRLTAQGEVGGGLGFQLRVQLGATGLWSSGLGVLRIAEVRVAGQGQGG